MSMPVTQEVSYASNRFGSPLVQVMGLGNSLPWWKPVAVHLLKHSALHQQSHKNMYRIVDILCATCGRAQEVFWGEAQGNQALGESHHQTESEQP